MPVNPAEKVGLPPRPFLYTVDQISVITMLSENTLHIKHIYHEGRDIGARRTYHLVARNIAPPDEKPDWRVVESELIRWLKSKGYKYYDRGTVR